MPRKVMEVSLFHLKPESISCLKVQDCKITQGYFCFLRGNRILVQVPCADILARPYGLPRNLHPILQRAAERSYTHVLFHAAATELFLPVFHQDDVLAAFTDAPMDEWDIENEYADRLLGEFIEEQPMFDASPMSVEKMAGWYFHQLKRSENPLDFDWHEILEHIFRLGHVSALLKFRSLSAWGRCDGELRVLLNRLDEMIEAAHDIFDATHLYYGAGEGLLFAAQFAIRKSLLATRARWMSTPAAAVS